MSSTDRDLIEHAIDAIASRTPDDRAWDLLDELGFTSVGFPVRAGGAGGSMAEAATVITTLARHARSVPVAERIVGGRIAAAAGLQLTPGSTSVVIDDAGAIDIDLDGTVVGCTPRVPFARATTALVVLGRSGDDHAVAVVDRGDYDVELGANLAGEPCDDVTVRTAAANVSLVDEDTSEELRALARFIRGLQIQGALEAVLALTIDHARSRHQFGRPIADFQAVKHQLAALAAEVAAVRAANEGALLRVERGHAAFELLAARLRCSLAATTAAAIAHQLHGAIGTTLEHPLHRFTSRLWSWREELGDEEILSAELARILDRAGPGSLWPVLTGTANQSQTAFSPP